MDSTFGDSVLISENEFEELITRKDLHQIEEKLISDLKETTQTFNDRLNRFRSRILSLLYLVIDGNSSPGDIAELLCSVQKSLSARSPFELPTERVMLYVGPESLDDPLLVASVVTDFLWIFDQELSFQSTGTSQDQRRERFVEVSSKLIEGFIPPIMIRERMELEFQHELGIISDVKNAHRRGVRTRTSLLYVQKKYNLFREESEGFSRLFVEISLYLEKQKESTMTGEERKKEMQEAAQKLLHNILSLSGHFSIDPNRILDVLLDLFALNIADHWEFFIYLLEISPWKTTVNTSNGAGMQCTLINEVLGTKFTGYDLKSFSTNISRSIYVMAALLIKHKFVDLDYLYSRLSPPDIEFESIAEKYRNSIKEKEGNSGRFQSQFILGQLGDLGVSSTAVTSASQSSTPSYVIDPVKIKGIPCYLNQKASLVKASLEIGDVKTAFSIMGRVPKIPEIYSDIPELICRLLYHIISPHDPNPVAPISSPPLNPGAREVVKTISVIKALISSRITRVCKSHSPHYEYFYNLWSADLPVITDSLRFVTRCRVYLSNVGVNLHRDPVTLAKLIRIGAKHVAESKKRLNNASSSNPQQPHLSNENMFFSVNHPQVLNFWLSLVSASILPAISRADPNPANSYGLWQIIGEYPPKTRYALYGEWKYRIYEDHPEVRIARTACLKDCQYIMIRLSKDVIKQSGRQIAKVVRSNPLVSFTYIIRQIKSYDNMIPHMIDATRYLTDLEFDIFGYCITEALSSEKNSRWEGNDITIASWLKYLASFTGKLYRKHPIDITGLLIYIMSQLLKGNIYELIVLQELVGCMSGIRPIDEITNAQLESLSGCETLRREVFFYENSKAVKKSSSRLSKALIDTGLAPKFAIIMAQLRQRLTSHDPGDEYEKNQKTVIWLSDFCGKSLIQYIDFMSTDLSLGAYRSAFPGFEVLVDDYSLDPEYAFAICRPILSHSLQSLTYKGDINNSDTRQKCINAIMKILPETVWEGISPHFYLEFWRFSSKDFFCPSSLYASEIKAQQKIKKSFEAELAANTTNTSKFNKKLEKTNSLIKALEAERATQENYNKNVIEYIKKESKSWFSKSVGHNETINTMIQYCLYPRCIFSPSDAVYTAKFILLMHSLGVPNIATISLYDKLLNGDIFHAMTFSASEDEAKSYGIFLCHTFDTLSSWRKFPELFEKEAIGVDLPGFLKKWPLKSDQTTQMNFSTAEYILHNEFRQAMRKWHLKMFRAITYCLRSGDFVRVRNSFFILDKLIEHFPITKEMGKHLEHCVLEIEKNEVREDLKQLARSYYSKMQINKHIWVDTSDFCPAATQKPTTGEQNGPEKGPPFSAIPFSLSTKPPDIATQNVQTSNIDSPLVSMTTLVQNNPEDGKSTATVPQQIEADNVPALKSGSSVRFCQTTRSSGKMYSPALSASVRENYVNPNNEDAAPSHKKPITPTIMDYPESEKGSAVLRQTTSPEGSKQQHPQKSASDIRNKSTFEPQTTKSKPNSELCDSERRQDHPKVVKGAYNDYIGNRSSSSDNIEHHVHPSSRNDIHSNQNEKGTYSGSLNNINYYQKRNTIEEVSAGERTGNIYHSTTPSSRSGPPLHPSLIQTIPSTTIRVQEVPAIDIVSGHQQRHMNLFIMRPHNAWPRNDDSTTQQLYHGKPLKIPRTRSDSDYQLPSNMSSGQRSKVHSELSSSLKKYHEDPKREDFSSKEYRSHERDKKKPRTLDRSKYTRKRKERVSDQFNGSGQDKRVNDRKLTKRYSKSYSNSFDEVERTIPLQGRDSKGRDSRDPNRPIQGNPSAAVISDDPHRSPNVGHQGVRNSFHPQNFQ